MKKMLIAALLASALPAAAHNNVPHDQGLPRATIDQLHALTEAIDPYRDFETARREGWKKFGGDEPLMGEHWHHPEGPDYVGSRPDLDFTRPSNLMYTEIGGEKVLTGVTFNVRLRDGEAMPEGFAGRADKWHAHDMLRAINAALEERPILRWLANSWIEDNYLSKGDDRGRIAMVHVWLGVPNPDGVFADHNRTLPYLKLGLPLAHSQGASMEAAHGLSLATKNGCAEQVDGRLWIANAKRKASRAIKGACDAAARQVRAALGADKATLNRTAETAWRAFDASWNANLTPVQRARIDAMSEHGDHDGHGGGHDAHGGHAGGHDH